MVIKSSPNVFQLLIQALCCGTLKNRLNMSLLGVFFCTICQQKINNYYFYESTPQPIPRFLPRAHSLFLPVTSSRRQQRAHLEADVALLAAEAGQHEEDEGEEAGEGDGHHRQGRRPRQLAQRSPICKQNTAG